MRSLADNRATVLVVDDHAGLRVSLHRLLQRWGYAVLLAENGAAAFEHLRAGRVDVIILDMDMPVMNGLAFLAARATDRVLSRVPVVVYSADPQPAAVPRGVSAWIWKGNESSQLLAALEAALAPA